MTMKKFFGLITLIIGVMFFTTLIGCTSVPEVDRYDYDAVKKQYDVVIDKDYIDNPVELEYALNSFVKDKGGTSYNVVKHGSNDFYVTIPGKTPVKDLPKVRHFHVGKTVVAIVVPTAGALLLLWIFSPLLF
jgi:hypothetical protein